MNEHPIQGLMKTTMDNIKEMIDVNTIVGDAVETPDGSIIIPVSKVSFGFAAGGAEYALDTKTVREESFSNFPFGGGSGAGVSVQPVAFLVVGHNTVKLLPVYYNNVVERIVDAVPNVLDNIEKAVKKIKKDNAENKENITSSEEEHSI